MSDPNEIKPSDAVLAAIKSGDLSELKKVIEDGWSLNTMLDTKHGTALHCATALDRPEMVDWLLQSGANPNKFYDKHNIPPALHYACFQGYSNIVRSLILFKADAKQAYQGITAMTQAASAKHFNIVKYLHSHDPSTIHQLDGFMVPAGLSVFDNAVQSGDIKMMQWVKDQAVDLTHPLPIHVAVKYNKKEAVDKIIEWGGDINEAIVTAVAMSRISNQLNVFKRLKEYGADFNFNNGRPLRIALRADPNSTAVKQLIRLGADVNCNNGALLKSLIDEDNLKGLDKALENGGDIALLHEYEGVPTAGGKEESNELKSIINKHSGTPSVRLH